MPRFSNGWLMGFKDRHSVRQYTQNGESGEVDRVTAAYEVERIQQLLSSYNPADIFNCDETGLFCYKATSWTTTRESTNYSTPLL